MLHSLLAAAQTRLGLEDHPWLDDAVERAAVFALAFLGVDLFFCRGPLRGPLLRLFSQGGQSKESQRRFLSQLAAKLIGIVFLSAIMPLAFQALADPALAGGDRFRDTTPVSWRMVEIGSGYFLYDIIICLLKFSDNGFEFMLHAVVCCSVFLTATAKGVMHYYGAAFLMWELSTPLMYVRWLMLKAGLGKSALMPLVNVAFMLVFFGCRNVWGPIMTLRFWRDGGLQLASSAPALPHTAIHVIRVMAIALNCLNTYWFSQMVRIAVKGGKPKQKAV
ncbi:hypothetical protein COHA_008342 [Chlorella ohadii]|uniref:TLC domain-containing protein n=1 Tax=Chlorella ohadii TaxID=2649997 RepID=A0AAD5DP15_9CHLO|nr:hypothetical protein COHA_008342 [Chlorella ohadii]